jgi:hypothetical protein
MSDKIIWQAAITADMVEDWTEDEIEMLIADLDDAVKSTYEDWELRD